MIYNAVYNGKLCVAKKEHEDKEYSKKLLKQEKKVLGYLKTHPCIVQPLIRPVNPKSQILLMEIMLMNLKDFLISKQSYHSKVTILQDVACGLSYIHEQGIIHCNLTGESILVTEKGRAKLSDFGQAIFYQRKAVNNLIVTVDTLDYMPPEILKPMPNYSTKLDVFSFGCVIIHTVTGEPPIPDCDKFVETTEAGKYKVYSEVDRRSIIIKKLRNTGGIIRLYNIVLECLQEDPSDRPTAAALYSLLKKQEVMKIVDNLFKCKI